MLSALIKLTWLEVKIFVREPLGLVGTVMMPIVVFLGAGRALGGVRQSSSRFLADLLATRLPVLAALLMIITTLTSLVAVISIYREGGILKRLRATPLSPVTILAAHVLVKLLFTGLTLALLLGAGKRYYPADISPPLLSFAAALLLSTLSLLSIGFIIASLVPTARFAQPFTALVAYPMIALSGLFVPINAMPPALRVVARLVPFTYAVSLLRGIWEGESWLAHAGDVAALLLTFAIGVAISARVFRWQ